MRHFLRFYYQIPIKVTIMATLQEKTHVAAEVLLQPLLLLVLGVSVSQVLGTILWGRLKQHGPAILSCFC